MSLLGSIGKVLTGVGKGVLGTVRSAAPSIIGAAVGAPVVGTAVGAVLSSRGGGGGGRLPPVVRPGGGLPSLPPGGKSVALSGLGIAAASAAGDWLYDKFGNPVRKKRRRRKGISSKDLQSFKRVARLVDKFSKPVHHFRNFKKGS